MKRLILAAIAALALLIGPAVVATAQVVTSIPPSCWTGVTCSVAGTARLSIGTTGLLQFAGTTSSFPALKRNTTALEVRLADDSGYAAMNVGPLLGTANIAATTYVSTGTVAVASLPTCNSGTKSARDFVTDATVAASGNFAAVVAGGGANNVPVYCDGTSWKIG